MNEKRFGLEERTYLFAKKVRLFVKKLPKTIGNYQDGAQLIRSSGSIAANFIESVEALSEKDSVYRKKICRKESKESVLWLRLIDTGDLDSLESERIDLKQEGCELMRIFGSMVTKKTEFTPI